MRIGGPLDLHLRYRHQYRIVEAEGDRGPWKVTTVKYSYGLEADGREIVSFQWHPDGASSMTEPHLHLGAGAEIGLEPLAGAHVPTGRVSIEDVLLFAIQDLKAEPKRDDWDVVLRDGKQKHEQWRTWPAPKPNA